MRSEASRCHFPARVPPTGSSGLVSHRALSLLPLHALAEQRLVRLRAPHSAVKAALLGQTETGRNPVKTRACIWGSGDSNKHIHTAVLVLFVVVFFYNKICVNT